MSKTLTLKVVRHPFLPFYGVLATCEEHGDSKVISVHETEAAACALAQDLKADADLIPGLILTILDGEPEVYPPQHAHAAPSVPARAPMGFLKH